MLALLTSSLATHGYALIAGVIIGALFWRRNGAVVAQDVAAVKSVADSIKKP